MSFEEHIRKNRDKLKLKRVKPELWDRIDNDLQMPTTSTMKFSKIILVALGLVLLSLIGFFIWQNQQQNKLLQAAQQQIYAMRSTMDALLQDRSSFKRIKGVNISHTIEQADPDILTALTNTMLHDEDAKVRLAAVNALERFAEEPLVKNALITALEESKEPFFRIKIIKILASIKDKSSLPLLNQIIEDDASQDYLREEAIAAQKSITTI